VHDTDACSVTASVVNYLKYKYFKYVFETHTEYFVFCIWNKLQQYFVLYIFWVKSKVLDRNISNTIFKSILCSVFNTLPKSIFYNCGNGDRHVGIYASPDHGVLVKFLVHCKSSNRCFLWNIGLFLSQLLRSYCVILRLIYLADLLFIKMRLQFVSWSRVHKVNGSCPPSSSLVIYDFIEMPTLILVATDNY